MKGKQMLLGSAAGIGMLILIFDGQTAVEGAKQGINLCLQTVIPSLFPFFILSILLTQSLSATRNTNIPLISNILGIPKGSESILLCGFLGGYPVGAQCISSNYLSGNLTKKDAEHMLRFCNNAGPSFLFGMIAPMFPERKYAWTLWCIHILSALMAGALYSHHPGITKIPPVGTSSNISDVLTASLRVMSQVCGWIILFRIIITFLDRWLLWILPCTARVLLIGILELSNGCCFLPLIDNLSLRFIVCSVILAFGGLCVSMQTFSVIHGLALDTYLEGKILQMIFSFLLCIGYLFHIWFPIICIALFILWKKQKYSSNHRIIGV